MLIRAITLGPVKVKLWSNEVGEYFAEIYIDGNLWDWREFDTLDEANVFMANPLADDRARERAINAAREKQAIAMAPKF